MKSNKKITMNIFGKERQLDICLVGDNEPEYNLETNQLEIVELTKAEERLLDWIKMFDISICKEKIVKYINYMNEIIEEGIYNDYDLSDENVFLPMSILINVREETDDETADIALFGESEYTEDGIMIAFKNGNYLGISGFNDLMNYWEDFE